MRVWTTIFVAMACLVLGGCPQRYVYERAEDGVVSTETVQVATSGAQATEVTGYLTVPETGVQLWYRRTGPIDAPAVVLLNGLDFPSSWWHGELVEALLDGGFQVIRYDNRDSGRSEHLPFPKGFKPSKYQAGDPPPYPLTALRDDCAGLMTALEVEQAHLVGVSMGGMVAQLMALEHQDRVRSLTLLSTSPSNSFDPELDNPDEVFMMGMAGQMKKAGMAYFMSSSDRWMDKMVEAMQTITAASDGGEDFRAFLEENRETGSFNFKSGQGFAIASAHTRVADLPRITAPTLILHGTADPWFRYSHAELLDELIPDSRLVAVEGEGHAMPRSMYSAHLAEVVGHLQAAQTPPPAPVPETESTTAP